MVKIQFKELKVRSAERTHYVTFDSTALTLFNSSTGASGTFDSLSHYNIKPTLVVTGTSASNEYYVLVNNSTGEYTITGSVSPIPPFYAPNGINLKVYGRGGSDILYVGAGAAVTITNDTGADGTTLQPYAIGDLTLYNVSSPTSVAPPATLLLPGPANTSAPVYSTLPTAGDTFTPPLTAAISDGPEIIQATSTAAPGDVIALESTDFYSAETEVSSSNGSTGSTIPTTQYWVYGQTTSGNADWEQASIVSNAAAGTTSSNQSITAVSIQLPSSLPAHSLYLLYQVNQNSSGVLSYSQAYEINQPQVWWMDGNNNYVGGKVTVFGTNLAYNVNPTNIGQSWVYLFPSNSSGGINSSSTPIILPVTTVPGNANGGSGAMDVNPYKVDFYLPQNLSVGSYQVEIYNGHGGIYGLGSAAVSGPVSLLTLGATPTSQTFSLYDAYNASNGSYGTTSNNTIWLDEASGLIDPKAVNIAIQWASATANASSESYVAVQLPAGAVQITDSSDIINVLPHVHLVGAGDTENAHTGTVIEVSTSSGMTVEGLIGLPIMDNNAASVDMGISDMSLNSHGKLGAQGAHSNWYGAIFDEGAVSGLTLQRLTIDATTDNPAAPDIGGIDDADIWINYDAVDFQLLDSTVIGAGLSADASHTEIDNCHFIGCSTIYEVIGVQNAFENSITRVTVTSLVNNILCPGGDVARDSCKGLIASTEAYPGLYVGNCITSDIYNSNYGYGDGEQISVEPMNGSGGTHNVISAIIYQNTLSGDGFETLQNGQDTIGISINVGENLVVVDNDISNVNRGIEFWGGGGHLTYQMPFDMTSDNSIHNVLYGLYILPNGPVNDDVPWFIGNSFDNNLISGGQPGLAGIYIQLLVGNAACPTQILMNVFNGNVITDFKTALDADTPSFDGVDQAAIMVCSNGFFFGDGSSTSALETGELAGFVNPVEFIGLTWQGYWSLP